MNNPAFSYAHNNVTCSVGPAMLFQFCQEEVRAAIDREFGATFNEEYRFKFDIGDIHSCEYLSTIPKDCVLTMLRVAMSFASRISLLDARKNETSDEYSLVANLTAAHSPTQFALDGAMGTVTVIHPWFEFSTVFQIPSNAAEFFFGYKPTFMATTDEIPKILLSYHPTANLVQQDLTLPSGNLAAQWKMQLPKFTLKE